MILTSSVNEIIEVRIKRDPQVSAALLDEALSLFLNGEPDTARLNTYAIW
jgi:hypothetical protein